MIVRVGWKRRYGTTSAGVRFRVSTRSRLHTLCCVCVSEVSHLLASLAAPRWCGANGYRVDRCGVPEWPLGGFTRCVVMSGQPHADSR